MTVALNAVSQPLGATLPASGKQLFASIVLVTMLLNVSACIPLALTAAVVDVSLDRRSAGTYLDDNTLEVRLRKDISREQSLIGINASVTAFNGIVLVTGQANNDAQRQRVTELAQKYKEDEKIRSVVNDLELSGKTNISSRLNDAWITGKVKAKLLNVKNLPTNTVKVVTEHGKVYLLGQVTAIEAAAAVESLRSVSGVTHIVKVFEYIE